MAYFSRLFVYLAQVICTGGLAGGTYVCSLPSGPMKIILGGDDDGLFEELLVLV